MFTQNQHGSFTDRLKVQYPIRLSGRRLLHPRPFYSVGESGLQKHYFETTCGRRSKGSRRIPRSNRQKRRYILSRVKLPQQRAPPFTCSEMNPGPRRGRGGAVEKQTAGKWQVITLQESIVYVDHELLTNRFHVTHYGGCVVLSSKDTLFLDIISRASFRPRGWCFIFRCSIASLALEFHCVDHIGLNLNYRKCCWVQHGSEGREFLWHWLSENCEEFRKMQIVRYAKYVGTMIGRDTFILGRHLGKIIQHFFENQCFYQKPG